MELQQDLIPHKKTIGALDHAVFLCMVFCFWFSGGNGCCEPDPASRSCSERPEYRTSGKAGGHNKYHPKRVKAKACSKAAE